MTNEYNPEYDDLVDEEFKRTVTPAAALPDGWNWVDWTDGSGHLEGPNRENLFDYDCLPYANAGGIEYQASPPLGSWNVHWGSLSEFKARVESIVSKNYLQEQAPTVTPDQPPQPMEP